MHERWRDLTVSHPSLSESLREDRHQHIARCLGWVGSHVESGGQVCSGEDAGSIVTPHPSNRKITPENKRWSVVYVSANPFGSDIEPKFHVDLLTDEINVVLA